MKGFTGMLTVLFVALKLIEVITWSWLWVLSPVWLAMMLAFLYYAIFLIAAIILQGSK